MVGVVVIGVAIAVGTRFVATDGASGVSAADSTGRSGYVEFGLVVVTLLLLLWVPQLFFYIQLDMDAAGDAQRVLLGLIAVTASIVTGIYILLLHFRGGPLRGISLRPLAVGAAGLVVLITPVYRSLAGTCWSRGISDIVQFSKYRQDWGKTLIELRKAIDRASERSIARGSGAAAVEAAAPRPRSERPAPRPAQGWPKWGLLAACAIVTFGSHLAIVTANSNYAVVTANSNYGASIADGLLVIVGFITALACVAVMLLRGIIQRVVRGEAIDRASEHSIARGSGAAAVEVAAPRPRSERPATRPAQGWPKWGLLAACVILTFGICIAAATANANSGANVAGGLLIIGAFVIALTCAAVMFLRWIIRIIQHGVRQRPTGATSHAIASAPTPTATRTTVQ
jgi:hypothetical protein